MLDKEMLKEMPLISVYTEVSKHMADALQFHSQMAEYFAFLGLCGFEKMHEYQYFAETVERKMFRKKILSKHNKLIPELQVEFMEVVPKEWYNYTRMDVDDNSISKFVKQGMKKYKKWEEETKEIYETICARMVMKGEISDFLMFKCYLEDVEQELKHIYEMCEKLNITGYDILNITDMQEDLYEEYEDKMEHLKVEY